MSNTCWTGRTTDPLTEVKRAVLNGNVLTQRPPAAPLKTNPHSASHPPTPDGWLWHSSQFTPPVAPKPCPQPCPRRGPSTLVVQQGDRRPWLQPPQRLHAPLLLQVQQLDQDDRVDLQQTAARAAGRPARPAGRPAAVQGAQRRAGASWGRRHGHRGETGAQG